MSDRQAHTLLLAAVVALIIVAIVVIAACGATDVEPADTLSPTTTRAVAFTVTNLPPPLSHTTEATVTIAAARGPQIQLTEPPPAPPTTTIPTPPHYTTWLKLAQCESGGDWTINTGNGYYGGLQFGMTAWRATGGWQIAPRPDLAEPLAQMWAAEVLLSMQGWGAWPACSRRLGLR